MTWWKTREICQEGDYILFELAGRRYAALPLSTPAQAILASSTLARCLIDDVSLVSIFPLSTDHRLRAEEARFKVEWHLRQDVLCHDFLTEVLFTTADGQQSASAELVGALKEFGTQKVDFLAHQRNHDGLEGPFLIGSGTLRKVYRLYDDNQGAFMIGLTPSRGADGFEPLRIGGSSAQSISVAVPSRGSPEAGLRAPLSGFRIAVKDIFDIKGIRQSACNRAYYEMSSPALQTAPSVQKLIDAGCYIVGTTKLSSMISREEPTEATDYQAPFNPRGDGYQSPAGSSSGSAAAVASYDWLDLAIGTDSTGSSRRPALVNGCFQIRLSSDATSLDGLMPCFPMFDAIAFFGRDLDKFHDIAQVWLGSTAAAPAEVSLPLPIKIYYPSDYFPVANTHQMEIVDKFLEDLEATGNVSIVRVSIEDDWNSAPPKEAGNQTLKEFLHETGKHSFFYDFTKSSVAFREAYVARYGRQPYVNPVVRWRWSEGEKITETQRNEAVDRMRIYAEWLRHKFFESREYFSIIALPVSNVEPNYRDVPPGSPSADVSWSALFLAPLLRSPEITFPIGEVSYESRITAKKEKLPVALSFLGPSQSDLDLIELTRKLIAQSGRSLTVATGKSLYD